MRPYSSTSKKQMTSPYEDQKATKADCHELDYSYDSPLSEGEPSAVDALFCESSLLCQFCAMMNAQNQRGLLSPKLIYMGPAYIYICTHNVWGLIRGCIHVYHWCSCYCYPL